MRGCPLSLSEIYVQHFRTVRGHVVTSTNVGLQFWPKPSNLSSCLAVRPADAPGDVARDKLGVTTLAA